MNLLDNFVALNDFAGSHRIFMLDVQKN